MLQFCQLNIPSKRKMIEKVIFFFFLSINVLSAQNSLEIGINYGSSDIFRQNDQSYYNYKNTEFGIFAAKNLAWKKNEEDQIQKFWMIQPQIYFGNYEFLAENYQQNTFRGILYSGIKLEMPFQQWSAHTKLLLGAGYQSGYYQRLAKGVFMTEKLSLGLNFKMKSISTFADIGIMHVSNANLYQLNRGHEVFFVEFGINLPKVSSK
ncbi:MAG: acyloxyacyl hydrolase [Flavobacteriaceae bacterium]|nr:acyloxyacyl hydrolase [Flavobacteriaceae bacterium]